MTHAYIVDAVRTPVGRRGGALSQIHPNDLGAHVLQGLVDRTGIDPAVVEDVIFGCVDQVGAQSANIARNAWLAAGLPEGVPGTTIDRQCGSSQQAVHFAAQAVLSGTQDVVVAGGVENMSLVPIGASAIVGHEANMGFPFAGIGWEKRFGDQEVSQFRGAELIAERWNISREAMEEHAVRSHHRAAAATEAGHFTNEILPIEGLSVDEGIRPNSTVEKISQLKLLRDGGRLTAAVSSQISDGASALLIASEEAVAKHNLSPLARIHTLSVVGSDPIEMLSGPIPATQKALARSGLSVGDIDRFEINEAFASVSMAWLADIGADDELVNPSGGAIALGHPLGASGGRLMSTLVHGLRRTGGRYGLQSMCEGGGMANATIIEIV